MAKSEKKACFGHKYLKHWLKIAVGFAVKIKNQKPKITNNRNILLMNKTIVLLTGIALTVGFSAQAQSTIADWTFETSQPATAGPFNPETGSGSALGSHAGASVYSSPAGNGSTHSDSSTVWAVNDYYQIQVSTVGYDDITLSWDQTSSNTGPGKFLLQYSTDGTHFTAIGSDYTVLANASPNVAWNISTRNSAYTFAPDLSSLNLADDATLYFRFTDDSTTSANNGTVATGGTDRIDNILVQGTSEAVPEPSALALFGIGGTVCMGFLRRFKK